MAAIKKVSKVSKVPRVSRAKEKGISVDSYSVTGEKKGTVSLPEALFGQKPNTALLAQAVRVFLSNQRSAHAKVKGRGEIQGSTRKIYKQKGTGGARHGARSAPIFVGGGIAHGPHGIENYDLVLPRTLRKKALISALSARVQNGSVSIAEFDKVEAKTGKIALALQKMALKKPLTMVYTENEVWQAGRNIANLNLVTAGRASAYHVLLGNSLIVTPRALEVLEARVKPTDTNQGKEIK
ncbi:MAG: large subunit ribosomal protein L4 [Microgenomates group bacterium Gr01-1014_5]|nr:MAG: large subunit ribosomal protein L4 [Microgenomates group bacterium Gr01-1014_5]